MKIRFDRTEHRQPLKPAAGSDLGRLLARMVLAGACGASLFSLQGCKTVAECCTDIFAGRVHTIADSTVPPARKSSAGAGETRNSEGLEESKKSGAASEADPAVVQTSGRFSIPKDIPGADATPLKLPPFDASQSPAERRSLIGSLFPEVKSAGTGESVSEDTVPLELSVLQQMALDYSPVIHQAAADVEMARGQAVQAGLYPNPTAGYQSDTVNTGSTAGYHGAFLTQEFVTAGKLDYAQSAATMKMKAAEADLRKARIALASDVRRGYFSVLLAQEQLKFNRAIAQLAEEVYKAQIDLVSAGQAAPYEPLQLRVFAVQARNGVIQAENNLKAEWRRLAASMGMPEMQRQPVAGHIDMPVPDVDDEAAYAYLLANHTDLQAAQALISSACYNLRLQEVTPIPNVTVNGVLQHDDTTTLNHLSYNLQVSVPLPVFNKNQGNITSAHAELARANQNLVNTRNELTSSLADAYNRYSTNRIIAESYRTDILQDQVRVYRGVYDRFRQVGETVDFAQVVVAQQNLSQAVSTYLQTLGNQWSATVDLAELLQLDDLFSMETVVGGVGPAMQPEQEPQIPSEVPDVPPAALLNNEKHSVRAPLAESGT